MFFPISSFGISSISVFQRESWTKEYASVNSAFVFLFVWSILKLPGRGKIKKYGPTRNDYAVPSRNRGSEDRTKWHAFGEVYIQHWIGADDYSDHDDEAVYVPNLYF